MQIRTQLLDVARQHASSRIKCLEVVDVARQPLPLVWPASSLYGLCIMTIIIISHCFFLSKNWK